MWQPIETAPRDGTRFIAAIEYFDRHDKSRWDMHIVSVEDSGEINLCDYQGWDLGDYTHWQPLPAPPTSAR